MVAGIVAAGVAFIVVMLVVPAAVVVWVRNANQHHHGRADPNGASWYPPRDERDLQESESA